ncbi:hypothetical protein TRIP_B30016 [uncultured Desulfatiglans sp.]|nr:hypothetical protein TRIP_B30016 [uncultured Desulfatiglans sp.]
MGEPNLWKRERHLPAPGKRVGILRVHIRQEYQGKTYRFQRVMRAVERTGDKRGQLLLKPDIEMEAWWTTLDLPDEKVIRLYETTPPASSSTVRSNPTWTWNACHRASSPSMP